MFSCFEKIWHKIPKKLNIGEFTKFNLNHLDFLTSYNNM